MNIGNMSHLIPRALTAEINKRKDKFPILAITGPRQSGKTTLLKSLFPDYTYVTLENADNRSFAADDPNDFLKQYPKQAIFDEVQRLPKFPYIFRIVRGKGPAPSLLFLAGP